MDRATSRSGRPLRRRHDGVDGRLRWSGSTFVGRQPQRDGSSISADRGCGFLVGGGNPPSRFCTGTTSTIMSLGCATSAASRQRRWSNGAGQPRDSCCGALEQAASSRDLTAGDIDNYVATQGTGRWARVSTANVISALCAFLRYAAQEGWCSNRLAESISRPRLYQQELLAICPGLVCRSADAGRRRHGQATGYP